MAFPVPPRRLSEDQARSVMAEAIAVTQARIPAWTRADLIRYLGETLPAGMLADCRALEALAARAIGGGAGEQVELLSAPEWPRVPDGLRRAYAGVGVPAARRRTLRQPGAAHPGGAAPGARARTRRTAPGLGTAARLLGADRSGSRRSSSRRTTAEETGTAGSGLRMDQAAAAWYVLTSPRRAEVMVGPAGTGKTRTAIEMARVWHQAGMGPVVA